ncbi:MAG: hypothetical protein HRT44_08120, partial [Bdellovibrionales bacterium]|nr:hypothetical protein [Bdellovibrionales bacterium]NQZ19204.1 hypothetical protein [Bdellovibrionales bacterium]
MKYLFLLLISSYFSHGVLPLGVHPFSGVIPTRTDATQELQAIAEQNTACINYDQPERYDISDRPGAYYGLVLTMARSICRSNDDLVRMAIVTGRGGRNDALSHYGQPPQNERESLVRTYTLLLSHIYQETSGEFWEGVDITNSSSFTSETAEAGLCQSSNNIHNVGSESARRGFARLNQEYQNSDLCLTDTFSRGLNPESGREVIGSGDGAEFQRLMRTCPASAVEHCAIAIRHGMRWFGPLIKKKAPYIQACENTMERV